MRLLGSKICSWEFNEAMKVGVDVSVTKAEWFHGLGRDPNQARSTVSESWTRQQDLASHSNSSKVFKFLRGIPEKKPTPYWKHQLAFVTFFISFLPSNPPSSLDQKVAVILSRLSSRLKGPFSTQEASSVGGCLYFLRFGYFRSVQASHWSDRRFRCLSCHGFDLFPVCMWFIYKPLFSFPGFSGLSTFFSLFSSVCCRRGFFLAFLGFEDGFESIEHRTVEKLSTLNLVRQLFSNRDLEFPSFQLRFWDWCGSWSLMRLRHGFFS